MGANSFAIGRYIRPISVGLTGLSRMNSLPQGRSCVSRPSCACPSGSPASQRLSGPPAWTRYCDKAMTYGSEFIRDWLVHPTHLCRTYRPLANEFAPTGEIMRQSIFMCLTHRFASKPAPIAEPGDGPGIAAKPRPVGANSFARRWHGRRICAECTGVSRMNSLPQGRSCVSRPSCACPTGSPASQRLSEPPAWTRYCDIAKTCGSEFIRETLAWTTHLCRMYQRFANEFAPTGGQRQRSNQLHPTQLALQVRVINRSGHHARQAERRFEYQHRQQ